MSYDDYSQDFDPRGWNYHETNKGLLSDFEGSFMPPVDNDCCYDFPYEHETAYKSSPPYNSKGQYYRASQPGSDSWRQPSRYAYDYEGVLYGEEPLQREEHHLVEGYRGWSEPYVHENYQAQYYDGSYHGTYHWDANRRNEGRHIHQGSYGMERNSRQDVYYNDEAEYNLGHQDTSSSGSGTCLAGHTSFGYDNYDSTSSPPQRSARSRRDRQSSNRKRKDRDNRRRSGERHEGDGDWHREYHLVRAGRTATCSEEFITDNSRIARNWMSADRGRGTRGGGRRRWP